MGLHNFIRTVRQKSMEMESDFDFRYNFSYQEDTWSGMMQKYAYVASVVMGSALASRFYSRHAKEMQEAPPLVYLGQNYSRQSLMQLSTDYLLYSPGIHCYRIVGFPEEVDRKLNQVYQKMQLYPSFCALDVERAAGIDNIYYLYYTI